MTEITVVWCMWSWSCNYRLGLGLVTTVLVL